MNMYNVAFSQEQLEAGDEEAALASRLLLIASVIINFVKGDTFLILASVISITAGLVTIRAAKLEAEAQQIAPGVTTFANGLKLIGSHVSIIVSLLLFWALLIEIALRQPVGIAAEPTAAGTLGAFLV